MTLVYFDSSAFVKLVVDEDGSDLAADLWDAGDAVLSSRLAYPEVHAALVAAGRDHHLVETEERKARRAWERYWASVRPVELTEQVTAVAGRLARAHELRGAAAVHLASVLALGAPETVFAVWDQRLRAGARATGVRLAPA